MGFIEAIKHNFSNYATFSGRAQRSQFWWWYLFIVIVYAIANIGDSLIGWGVGKTTYEFTMNDQLNVYESPGVGFLFIVAWLVLLLPTLAVMARRLHDTDRSGWWILWGYLLAILCCIGFIILLVFWLQRGTPGDNKYGADPLTANG
ncbi:MAG: DUF805 domain-containing protein [Actinomycetota bacterium]|nr:DUF805 domain-containing protein [Actinomycetota bacterium]